LRIIQADNCIIGHNQFYEVDREAISLEGSSRNIINGNVLMDAGMETNDTYDALKLSTSTVHSTYNVITNNQIRSGQANKPQYGINEVDANQDYNEIIANIISDCISGDINNLGVNSDVAHNM